MAGTPAVVEAFTIDGYEDTARDIGRTVAIVVSIGALSTAGIALLVSALRKRSEEPLPRRAPTNWAFEGRRR